MKYKLLKVGSDAELFLTQDDEPFPVCGLVGGTKENPLPVLGGGGYAVQEDNVLLEFNIPPAANSDEFHASISKMLKYLEVRMKTHDLKCVPASSKVFKFKALAPHPGAFIFGCEPDYCVWTKTVNHSPSDSCDPLDESQLRTAGYHIHVSYLVDEALPTLADKERFVKAQDIFLGVPSVMYDFDTKRRKMYGMAGAFRPKEYGHEYRVLGSGILSTSPVINHWIFAQNVKCVEFLNKLTAKEFDHEMGSWANYIMTAINKRSDKYIQNILDHFGVEMPEFNHE